MSVVVGSQPTFDPGGVEPRPPSVGSMSSSSPELVREDLLEAWPVKCAYVVSEILQTEEAYLQALDDIIQGYQNPLATFLHSSGGDEGEEFIRTVFGNIDALRNTHHLLLERLKASSSDPHEFGEAFTETQEDFSVYTDYCMGYSRAEERLRLALQHNKDLRNFIMQCQQQIGHTLPLTSYLIKPVQRITKYHLLLKELLKPFNPEHYGHPSLQHALGAMASIAETINEVKKQEENALRVQELQSCVTGWSGKAVQKDLNAYGSLLFEDRCHVGKARAEREVLLFQKLLLILKKKDTKRYSYKGHLLAEELCLDEDSIDGSHFTVRSLQHNHLRYHIQTRSTRVQEQWVNRIKRLLSPLPASEEKMKVEVSSVREQRKRARRDIQSVPTFGTKRVHRRKRPHARKTIFGAFQQPSTTEPEEPQLSSHKRSREETYAIAEEPSTGLLPGPQPQLASQERHSGSQESLLSLSDVELEEEREGHWGVAESVDAPPTRRGPRRVKSQLKRTAAIRVKTQISDPQSSSSSLIRIKARLAREASLSPPPVHQPTTGMEGEDLSLLQLLGSAGDEEDQPMPWEREDSVGPSAVVVPDGDEIDGSLRDSEDDGIMIVEGSSDSEDESEDLTDGPESPSATPLMETEPVPDSSPATAEPHQQEYQVDSGEITQFFKKLSRGATPEEEGLHGAAEQLLGPPLGDDVFQFKGVADTYATLPRKPHPRTIQLSPQKKKISKTKSSLTLAPTPGTATPKRSSRFSCLVQFTRLQSVPGTPQKFDLSQSLPVGGRRLFSEPSEEDSVTSSLSFSLPESELEHQPLPAVWEGQPLGGQSDVYPSLAPEAEVASHQEAHSQPSQAEAEQEPGTEPEVSTLPSDATCPLGASEGPLPATVETERESPEREEREEDEKWGEVANDVPVSQSPGMEPQLRKRLMPHPSVEDGSTRDQNGTSARSEAPVSFGVSPLVFLRRTRLWGYVPSVRKGFLLLGIFAFTSFVLFSLNSRFSALQWSSPRGGTL